jgi:uncharacterized membrane protein YsdA (DUF1294 family)
LPRVLAIPLFAVLYAGVAWRWGTSRLLLYAYLAISALTFAVYALDKAAAQAGRWRTPEKTLHLLALTGGWPGALFAQQLLRHKTSKPRFIAVFWLTVMLNVGLFVAWHAVGLPQYRSAFQN